MRLVPTPEFDLILQCARMHLDESHAKRISSLLSESLDWDAILLVAQRHGLTLLLYRSLSAVAASQVPHDILQHLRYQYGVIRRRNLFFIRELVEALRALEASGITAMPYKGPVLAAFLYGDPALRQIADIDLLVKPCDAIKARSVLINLGFIAERRIAECWEAAYVRLHSEFLFRTLDREILVELHWRTVPWYWRYTELPLSAWNRLGKLPFAGISVPWFAPEDLLLVLCLHGCKHKWEGLKWLVDIAELVRACPNLDWEKIMFDANKGGYERILALSLCLANDLLDAGVPAHVLKAVRSKPLVTELAAELCVNLHKPHPDAETTLTQLPFLARAAERLDTKVCCQMLRPIYFLLHRVVRPAETTCRRWLGSLTQSAK